MRHISLRKYLHYKIKVVLKSLKHTEDATTVRFSGFGFILASGADIGFRAISGPAPGPYLIRALSPTEQLKSKNEGYFFVGVLREEIENEILKHNFYFRGGFLAGFGTRPTQGWWVARREQLGSENKRYIFIAVFRMESDFFFGEVKISAQI